MVTYAEALAACVARRGEPVSRDMRRDRTTVAWVARRIPGEWSDTYWLKESDGCINLVALVGAEERTWLLAGGDPLWPDRAVTPLPDALELAAAWLDGRR